MEGNFETSEAAAAEGRAVFSHHPLKKGSTAFTCRKRESQLPEHAVLRGLNQIHPLPCKLRLLRK